MGWLVKNLFYFKFKLNTLVFLNVPTDKVKKRTEVGRTGGLFLQNYLQTYIDINFLPCFGVGNSLLKFLKALYIPCTRFTHVAAGRITQRGGRQAARRLVTLC